MLFVIFFDQGASPLNSSPAYKPIHRPGFDVMVAFGVSNLFTPVDFHQNQTHALTKTHQCPVFRSTYNKRLCFITGGS